MPNASKCLVNHNQPMSDVTGGYIKLTPKRAREPAQQVEDRLLRLARSKRGKRRSSIHVLRYHPRSATT